MDAFLSDEKQKNLNRIQCAPEKCTGAAHAVGVAELLRRELDQREVRASTFREVCRVAPMQWSACGYRFLAGRVYRKPCRSFALC